MWARARAREPARPRAAAVFTFSRAGQPRAAPQAPTARAGGPRQEGGGVSPAGSAELPDAAIRYPTNCTQFHSFSSPAPFVTHGESPRGWPRRAAALSRAPRPAPRARAPRDRARQPASLPGSHKDRRSRCGLPGPPPPHCPASGATVRCWRRSAGHGWAWPPVGAEPPSPPDCRRGLGTEEASSFQSIPADVMWARDCKLNR